MTNTNGFSDSQESALLDDEVFDELKKQIGIENLPLLEEEVIEDEETEEVYDIKLTQKYPPENEQKRDTNDEQYLQGPEIPWPIKDDSSGLFNFQCLLNSNKQCSSKHWVYSSELNKIFINMEQTLPIRLKWEPPIDGLFVRAALVFSLDQYRNDPVRRCHNHVAMSKNILDVNPMIKQHVVRCLDRTSIYQERNEHLSILTPLRKPQTGSPYVAMYYQFMCKNSCASGMNRRPTELIFTLENIRGEVLGRQKLQVRICSCPKRDKDKEEAELMKMDRGAKRKKSSLPVLKKVMPSCDTHVFNVQLNMVGKENYLAVMKYAYDIMAGNAARTGQFEFFKPYMDEILRKIP